MRPVRTEDCNVQYRGAADVGDLPARRDVLKWVIDHPRKGIMEVDEPKMYPVVMPDHSVKQIPAQAVMLIRSTWELEPHEIEMIQANEGRCHFTILIAGEPVPPIELKVAPIETEAHDDEDLRSGQD